MNGEMASRDDHAEELRNITQCSVCRGRFMDPRALPCLHTFCLECIQHAGSSRSPGDQMACPLCRKEFTIPDGDFDGLQKDFRLQTLLELSSSSFGFTESGPEDKTDEMMMLETVFCFDCQTAISVREHFNSHRSHKCDDVVTAIRLLRDKVDKAERKVLGWKTEIHERNQELEAVREEFNRELSHAKRTVKKRGGELRVLVETHIRALENELEKLEEDTAGELDAEKEALDLQLVNIRRFVSKCEKLKMSKGSSLPADICRSATELCVEAENVGKKRLKILSRDRNSSRCVKIRLKTTQLEDFLAANSNNFVGTLQTISHSRPRSNVSTRTTADSIWRILRLLDVRILLSGSIGLAAGLSVMAGFNTAAGVVVGLCVTMLIFAVLYPLLPKTNSLRLVTSYRRQNRHSCGVTHLRHRIYVLLQSPSSVVVFSDASPSFVQLEEISLPQVLHPCDLASCHVTGRLYVSDSGTGCLWKLDHLPDQYEEQHHHRGAVSCWIRDLEKPFTVSVSGDGRIVAVREGRPFSSIAVYSPDGTRIGGVRLPATVTQPYHCVETSAGTYVVSHGTWISHTHGLIEVDGEGAVLAVYNSTECLWGILKAITLLIDPSMRQDDARHLAVDYNDRVFVADWFNDRIMQFDPGFRRHRMHVTSAASGLGWPILRLCYVKEKRQMLVVHETAKENKVNVYLMH